MKDLWPLLLLCVLASCFDYLDNQDERAMQELKELRTQTQEVKVELKALQQITNKE